MTFLHNCLNQDSLVGRNRNLPSYRKKVSCSFPKVSDLPNDRLAEPFSSYSFCSLALHV